MITAVGNVIVIGSIKGSVEAGCMGNDNAYIFALDFKPTDVRISKTHCNFNEFDTPNTENPKKAYLINNGKNHHSCIRKRRYGKDNCNRKYRCGIGYEG